MTGVDMQALRDATAESLWARVRAVDPDGPEAPRCTRDGCTTEAILQFRLEYECLVPVSSPEGRVARDIYACHEHMGVTAYAAAFEMISGPTGGV